AAACARGSARTPPSRSAPLHHRERAAHRAPPPRRPPRENVAVVAPGCRRAPTAARGWPPPLPRPRARAASERAPRARSLEHHAGGPRVTPAARKTPRAPARHRPLGGCRPSTGAAVLPLEASLSRIYATAILSGRFTTWGANGR